MRELIIEAFKLRTITDSMVADKWCGTINGIKYTYAEAVAILDTVSDSQLLEYYTEFLQDIWNFWRD